MYCRVEQDWIVWEIHQLIHSRPQSQNCWTRTERRASSIFFLGKQHPNLRHSEEFDEFGISYLFLLHSLKRLQSNSQFGNPPEIPKRFSYQQLQLKSKWCMWTRERNSSWNSPKYYKCIAHFLFKPMLSSSSITASVWLWAKQFSAPLFPSVIQRKCENGGKRGLKPLGFSPFT